MHPFRIPKRPRTNTLDYFNEHNALPPAQLECSLDSANPQTGLACPICFEVKPLSDTTPTHCGHRSCTVCFEKLAKGSHRNWFRDIFDKSYSEFGVRCPTCRKPCLICILPVKFKVLDVTKAKWWDRRALINETLAFEEWDTQLFLENFLRESNEDEE